MRWEDSTTLMPWTATTSISVCKNSRRAKRIQGGNRLVEQQQLGAFCHGEGERELRALPAGQGAGSLLRVEAQLVEAVARKCLVP